MATISLDLISKEKPRLWDVSDVVEANKRRVKAKEGSKAEKRIAEEKRVWTTYGWIIKIISIANNCNYKFIVDDF